MSRYVRPGPIILPVELVDYPMPEFANADDDEFEGAALNAAWRRNGTFDDVTALDPYAGFASPAGCRWNYNAMRPSWYLAQAPNGANPSIDKLVATPVNAFYYCRLSFNFRNAAYTLNDALCGFGLYDNALANSVSFSMNGAEAGQIRANCGRINAGVFTLVTNGLTDGAANASGGSSYFMAGIQKRATTYDFWLATTAGHWQHYGQAVHATVLDRFAFYWRNASVVAPGCMVVGIDFARVINGSVLP